MREDCGARHNDLRAFGINAFDSRTLPLRHFCQPSRQLFCNGQRHATTASKVQGLRRTSQCRCRPGSGNYRTYRAAHYFPRCAGRLLHNEVIQPLQFRFGGRIMVNKLLRQPDRAKRQRDNFFDMPFFRKSKLTAAPAQIDQQHFWWRRAHV